MRDNTADRFGGSEDDASLLSFMSGLALGLLIGLLTAILLAPKPGSETREDVVELFPNRGE